MLISQVNSIKNNNYMRYKNLYASKINFRGQLEDDYFKAASQNDTRAQLKILSSINFDVMAQEASTGNNFLHVALINNNDAVIKKAIALLLNKRKEERIATVLHKNNEGQIPIYYTNDDTIKLKLKNLIGMELPNSTSSTNEPILNELNNNEQIKENNDTIGFFDDTELSKEVSNATKANLIIQQKNSPESILSDVIGHEDVKETLNKLIIQPYKNNKFIPINGFLLYGPSGVGKTHIVKSLFKELNQELKIVSSAIEFENILNDAKAKYNKNKKQTLVFIDNIDALLPKMDDNRDNSKTSRLMQLIEQSSINGVVLIAATSKKYSIEPSAIAPGRFDEHIELSPLKADDRKKLIKFYAQKIQLSEDEIDSIEKKTQLLSPSAIGGIFKKIQFLNEFPKISDIYDAIEEYAKSQKIDLTERGETASYDSYLTREVIKEYDPKSLDEVKGMDYAKNTLYNTVIASFDPDRQKEYKENRINIPNGILLYGPPGCGKTYIIKAVAAQSKLPLYQIKMSEIGSKYVGETSNRIKQAFEQLRTKYKNTGEASILFFDECDSFFRKVGEKESYRTEDINTLKEEMNNAGRDGIIIVAATNEITNLNDAIVRDGRFDDKIFIDFPDKEARFGLIETSLENRPKTLTLSKDISAIQKLTEKTEGLSSAGITTVINKAVKQAIDSQTEEVSLEDLIKSFEEKREETLLMKNAGAKN